MKTTIKRDLIVLSGAKLLVLYYSILLAWSRGGLHVLGTAWDAAIYLQIVQHGYTHFSDLAFAPVFPFLEAWLGMGGFGGVLVANMFALATTILVYKCSNLEAALLFSVFPTFLLFGTVAYGLYDDVSSGCCLPILSVCQAR